MRRYTDTDKLLKELQGRYEAALSWYDNVTDPDLKIRAEQAVATFLECILTLKAQSIADVEEVRHGEWIPIEQRTHWAETETVSTNIIGFSCSLCGAEEKFKYKYCHCGAKMDKEKEE